MFPRFQNHVLSTRYKKNTSIQQSLLPGMSVPPEREEPWRPSNHTFAYPSTATTADHVKALAGGSGWFEEYEVNGCETDSLLAAERRDSTTLFLGPLEAASGGGGHLPKEIHGLAAEGTDE